MRIVHPRPGKVKENVCRSLYPPGRGSIIARKSPHARIVKTGRIWYSNNAAASPARKEAKCLADMLVAFIISVLAGVVSYYICKWLDRD